MASSDNSMAVEKSPIPSPSPSPSPSSSSSSVAASAQSSNSQKRKANDAPASSNSGGDASKKIKIEKKEDDTNTNNNSNNTSNGMKVEKPVAAQVPIKIEKSNGVKTKQEKKQDSDDDDSSSDSDDSDDDQPLAQRFGTSTTPSSTTSSSSSSSTTSAASSAKKPVAAKPKSAPVSAAKSSSSSLSASKPKLSASPSPSSPSPKPAAAPAKKVAKPPKSEDEDDDEEEDDDDDEEDDEDDSDASEDDDDDSDSGKKRSKRKSKSKSSSSSSRKKKKESKASSEGDEADKIVYDADNYEMRKENVPLKEDKGANKWWNREPPKYKWETLVHNGVMFPPPYEPHGVPVIYKGEKIQLEAEAEEVATHYATIIESDHVKNPVFNKNFFNDWKRILGKSHPIKDLSKCDFSLIHKHVMDERERQRKLKRDKAYKEKDKAMKEKERDTYGYAIVDGYKEKIGNYCVERPGLFMGRGKHPKTGMLKTRVQPEEVTLNIGRDVPIPAAPPGHKWKGIVHNKKAAWLAMWKDNVKGDFKYVQMDKSSRVKGDSDLKKYTRAQRLKDHIDKIREKYTADLKSKHRSYRQRATAIYLIDKLALRVGNEKNKDEEADTVGCCSLRVEHIQFPSENTVTFDFLGKDSMRYFNTVEVDPIVFKNMKEFASGKKGDEDLFETLDTTSLNEHLKEQMSELTAKVFRTYNASITLENELLNPGTDVDPSASIKEKEVFYNNANRTVAILCNHQRSVPKAHGKAMELLQEKEEELIDERDELQELYDIVAGKKLSKAEKEARDKAKRDRERRKTDREKKRDAERRAKIEENLKKNEASEQEIQEALAEYEAKKKIKTLPKNPTEEQLINLLAKIEQRIEDNRATIAMKEGNKTVALGTSKINYMDPRITVAWCKRKEMPIEKIFNKSLLAKFPWALEVPSDWKF